MLGATCGKREVTSSPFQNTVQFLGLDLASVSPALLILEIHKSDPASPSKACNVILLHVYSNGLRSLITYATMQIPTLSTFFEKTDTPNVVYINVSPGTYSCSYNADLIIIYSSIAQ